MPYQESEFSEQGRASHFALLTLRDDKVFEGKTRSQRKAIYDEKKLTSQGYADELFALYGRDSNSSLTKAEASQLVAGLGLPPTDARARPIASHALPHADLSGLLGQWDSLQCEFSAVKGCPLGTVRNPLASLGPLQPLGLDGDRAVAWIGRQVPLLFVLHAFRQLWPAVVVDAALMRNTQDNPQLLPGRMQVYQPSTQQGVAVVDLATLASAQDPVEKGGFVVRLLLKKGPYQYVPFRGLPENTLSEAQINPNIPHRNSEFVIRVGSFGVLAVVFFVAVGVISQTEAPVPRF